MRGLFCGTTAKNNEESCLIGSIFYPVLIYILLITVWAFLIVYIIATRYYSRKM